MSFAVNLSYFLSCLLLIISIRSLSSPKTARMGNLLGMSGIALAVAATFVSVSLPNYLPALSVLALGAATGIFFALRVKITALPQMVALLNGLGGLSAVCIAASETFSGTETPFETLLGLAIGGLAFSGSIIAFAKLQGLITAKSIRFPLQQTLNSLLTAAIIFLGFLFIAAPAESYFTLFAAAIICLGFLLVLPIGGADMPVVISVLNAYSGWASVAIGLSLNNTLLIIIGAIVGAGGSILAYIMVKAMNRSLINILTGGFTTRNNKPETLTAETKNTQSGSPEDAAFIMENAAKIIIVPGYGMAVAQAQHALKTMADILREKYGAEVKFAIHPVAGRMPGHMNVLLAEANVDYQEVFELNDINHEFASADVAYVIGANDITNPIAKTDTNSPLFGMPVLDVEKAKTVFFVKRSLNSGYSGVDNQLFYAPNTIMLYGDAKNITEQIVKALEQ